MVKKFIKTSDPDVVKYFKAIGLTVVSDSDGVVTFINDPSKVKSFFATNCKVAYTDKIEV